MIQYFLYCFATFLSFHNKKKTSSYFPCIKGKYSYLFIFKLSILIKKILECEKKFVLFLVGEAYKSCVFYYINKSIYCTVLMCVSEQIIESFKNLKTGIVDVFIGIFICLRSKEVHGSDFFILLYRKSLYDTRYEHIKMFMFFLHPFSC